MTSSLIRKDDIGSCWQWSSSFVSWKWFFSILFLFSSFISGGRMTAFAIVCIGHRSVPFSLDYCRRSCLLFCVYAKQNCLFRISHFRRKPYAHETPPNSTCTNRKYEFDWWSTTVSSPIQANYLKWIYWRLNLVANFVLLKNFFSPSLSLSAFRFPSVRSVDFQRRIHEGDEQGLAFGALLLLAMRRELDRTAVRSARRSPVLHQMLRECVREHLRRVREDHRNRLKGELARAAHPEQVILTEFLSNFAGSFVQGKALARGLLPLQQMPRLFSRQAIRVEEREDLLRQLLRRAVRLALRRLRWSVPRWYVHALFPFLPPFANKNEHLFLSGTNLLLKLYLNSLPSFRNGIALRR